MLPGPPPKWRNKPTNNSIDNNHKHNDEGRSMRPQRCCEALAWALHAGKRPCRAMPAGGIDGRCRRSWLGPARPCLGGGWSQPCGRPGGRRAVAQATWPFCAAVCRPSFKAMRLFIKCVRPHTSSLRSAHAPRSATLLCPLCWFVLLPTNGGIGAHTRFFRRGSDRPQRTKACYFRSKTRAPRKGRQTYGRPDGKTNRKIILNRRNNISLCLFLGRGDASQVKSE